MKLRRLSTRDAGFDAELAALTRFDAAQDPAVQDAVRAILADGADYGRSQKGGGERVNVEYVSANPTGPMHMGHCRGAVVGDALASLLEYAGYAVTREYYVNDAGAQVDLLARSAHLRYREALGEDIGAIPEGLYPGDYLKPVGENLASNHGRDLLDMPESEWLPLVRATAISPPMRWLLISATAAITSSTTSSRSDTATNRLTSGFCPMSSRRRRISRSRCGPARCRRGSITWKSGRSVPRSAPSRFARESSPP